MGVRTFFPNLLKTLKGRSRLAKIIADPDKTPILEGAAQRLADIAPTAEEVAKAEKLLNDKELSRLGITPGSLEQLLHAPHTITDPETKKWASDLYKSWDAANKRAEPYNAESILKNIEKSQTARSTSDYRGFEEGAPTTQEMRLRKLKEFAEGKAEGARDIYLPEFSGDLSKKAAAIAALTGGGLAASSLMPEEAEASPLSTAKKSALELFHTTRGAFSGEKLKPGADRLIHLGTKEQAADRFAELSRIKKTSPGAQTIPLSAEIKNPLELSDLSDWSANKMFRDMKKRGVIDEKQAQEIIDRSRATGKEIGNDINKDVLLDYIQKDLGHDAIKYKNIYEASEADRIAAAAKINPDMAKIPDLRSQKTQLESQLLDKSGKVKPSSRETDKIYDQLNKIDKQLRPLQNKLQSTFEKGAEYSYAVPESHGGILKSKLSGTPLAIGGATIGAGAIAASPSAQAAEGPTVSQSNPEFSSNSRSSQPKAPYLPSFIKPIVETALEGSRVIGKMEEEGKLPPDVTSYLYDTAYKYAIDPAKRKVMGALKGEEIPEDETPGYSDIYKQAMQNVGKENVGKFLKGFASSAAEDPSGMTQEAIESAKEEDVADIAANTAGALSTLAEDPLAMITSGASRLGRLPKTIRTLSRVRPK